MISVVIPHNILKDIRSYIRKTFTGVEQGGLLLGYRKNKAIEIQSVSFPSIWDQGTATLFHRSERGHRIKALREWVRSDRTVDWVGEWHTHPGGRAHPSSIDNQNWRKLVQHTGNPMVFLIFSSDAMYAGLQNLSPLGTRHLRHVERDDKASLYI